MELDPRNVMSLITAAVDLHVFAGLWTGSGDFHRLIALEPKDILTGFGAPGVEVRERADLRPMQVFWERTSPITLHC